MTGGRRVIVVSGMVGAVPRQGGATWAVLQYLLGFRELGHEVYLVEAAPASDGPDGARVDANRARYFRSIARRFDVAANVALLDSASRATIGMPYERIVEVARAADLLVNVAGGLRDPAILEPIPRRLYLDLDPGFTQLWQAVQGIDMGLDGHTHHATVGLALGRPGCPVPTCGVDWIPTLQPIVLSHWPRAASNGGRGELTTVANWRGYGPIEHRGVHYGQKAHSLRPLVDLPRRTDARFRLALAIDPAETADRRALARRGWRLADPDRAAGTPDRYQRFIHRSWAEFGLAKSGYVTSRSGWFSDRSVCYLASGRPVVAQRTGFERFLPEGEGLLGFDSAEEVVAGIESLRRDYGRHARAARAIAERRFDSAIVLGDLLRRVGLA